MKVTAPRGTRDILPGEIEGWQYLEAALRRIFTAYGYAEIRTPLFEHTELFDRGIGEATDVVQKEMYTFTDRGQRSLTLRPEGTAPVVRAYLEHGLSAAPQPVKLYYIGPYFRYERPQAGRYRQFYQFGAEAIGTQDPVADVEMIVMPARLYQELGLRNVQVRLNSIGCPQCRPAYRDRLREHLADVQGELCKSCQDRYERNPLRILDCKVESCRRMTADVPSILDFLCEECSGHFAAVRTQLERVGLPYTLDTRLVRGFDYYTKTVFELISPDLGAQDALGGGGRYDGLVEVYDGKPTPAVGFAAGMERILLVTDPKQMVAGAALDAYVACAGDAARGEAVQLAFRLRDAGLAIELDYLDKSLKAQMKSANRLGARSVVILGEDELAEGIARVRNMETGQEQRVGLDQLVEVLGDGRT